MAQPRTEALHRDAEGLDTQAPDAILRSLANGQIEASRAVLEAIPELAAAAATIAARLNAGGRVVYAAAGSSGLMALADALELPGTFGISPERVVVPSGTGVHVDYEPDQPVLAVRVQEVFGWRAAPRIADGRVPLLLHLLSPARRPVAVTADLESFWRTGYPQVRGELRRRYPRHAWPDDPMTAVAVRGTRRPREA